MRSSRCSSPGRSEFDNRRRLAAVAVAFLVPLAEAFAEGAAVIVAVAILRAVAAQRVAVARVVFDIEPAPARGVVLTLAIAFAVAVLLRNAIKLVAVIAAIVAVIAAIVAVIAV